MEVIVAGQRVQFRDEYPFKEYPNLITQYRAMQADNPLSVVPVAQQMVQGWEYEGDPADAESYQGMDAIALWGLVRAVNDFWMARLYADPKPLPAESTQP